MKTLAFSFAILLACNIICADARIVPQNTCQTAECVHAASGILKNMDKSVKPCDDFYRFACGGYLKTQEIPKDKTGISSFIEVSMKVDQQLRKSLERPIGASETKPFVLAKKLYKSCMNTSRINELGTKPLLPILKKLGGWPLLDKNSITTNWTNYVYKLRKLGLPRNMFMFFGITIDVKNNTRRLIAIDQPSLGLSKKYLEKGMQEKVVKAYYKYMVDLAVYLGADPTIAKKELMQSLVFEIELAKISLGAEDRRDSEKLYNLMTLKQLSKKYKSIPWKEYIYELLSQDFKVKDDVQIMVVVPSFFEKFEKLMQRTPNSVVANYVFSKVIKSLAYLLNEDFRKISFDFSKVLSGVQQQQPRWSLCLRVVSAFLGESLGALYVREYFQEDSKIKIVELVNYIEKQFEKNLHEVKWMDKKTKKSALEKAKAMLKFIAYPDELLDDKALEKYYAKLTFRSDDFFNQRNDIASFYLNSSRGILSKPVNKSYWAAHSESYVVNAFYSPSANSIEFPAGILQGIFFHKDRPRYMNYAAIGNVIGHEITHAFDDEGSLFDKEGSLKNWWTPETKAKYLEKTKCIVNQYSNFTDKEVNMSLNGINTQGENIADNGGIKVAYDAYERWTDENYAEEILPGLQEYNQKQLFWITIANVWCSKYRPESMKMRILTDPHAPSEFRINGPLPNMPEFSKDFNCELGSNMNPSKDKCQVW